MNTDYKMQTKDLDFFYGENAVLNKINLYIKEHQVTALIGPSGCGKSTLLRTLNRMNDLIAGAHLKGSVLLDGQNIYDDGVDIVKIRQRVGMVFQQPNPFPKSVFDNVAFGPRMLGLNHRMRLDEVVEKSLRAAALWDEVKGCLKKSALALSGGQQQRLCIARVLAVEPEVILMDEPCSALDPAATLKIEDLMRSLAKDYTIVVVTHNMQQAARVSDAAAFLMTEEERCGVLVEHGPTSQLFTNPQNKCTEDYITGRFG